MNTANIMIANDRDIERASYMVTKTGGNINPIILSAKVAMISELKRRLERGEIVEFDYIKKSTGTLRHAIGCLYQNLIASKIKGTGMPNSVYGNFTYFDLTKNQFRSFSYETIVKVY